MFRILMCSAALAAVVSSPAAAQSGGSPINDPAPSSLTVYGASGTVVDDTKVAGGKALRIEVAAKGANSWDAGVSSPIKAAVKAGDALVLKFWARLESNENGSTSTLPWNAVSLASPPWTSVLGGPAEIGPEWKQFEVRGTADKDYPAGSLGAGFQLATAKQVVELGPVEVVDVGASAAAASAASAPAPAQISTLATLDPDKIAGMIINDPSAPSINGAKGKLIDDATVMGGKAVRIDVPRKGTNPWDISVNSPVKKPVKAGDTLLLVFAARLVQGENGATTTLPWNAVSLASPPWTGIVGGSADIGPEWKTVEIRGKADKNYATGTLGAGIQLATARQTVDLGPIIVLDLGPSQ
jgi:hypothetical protein